MMFLMHGTCVLSYMWWSFVLFRRFGCLVYLRNVVSVSLFVILFASLKVSWCASSASVFLQSGLNGYFSVVLFQCSAMFCFDLWFCCLMHTSECVDFCWRQDKGVTSSTFQSDLICLGNDIQPFRMLYHWIGTVPKQLHVIKFMFKYLLWSI